MKGVSPLQRSGRAVLLRLLRVKLWVVGRCVVEVVRRWKGKDRAKDQRSRVTAAGSGQFDSTLHTRAALNELK